MLYFQVLFYVGSIFLLSYHWSQLIPDIYRTGLVQLGTLNQFAILLIYSFSSYILIIFWIEIIASFIAVNQAQFLSKLIQCNEKYLVAFSYQNICRTSGPGLYFRTRPFLQDQAF